MHRVVHEQPRSRTRVARAYRGGCDGRTLKVQVNWRSREESGCISRHVRPAHHRRGRVAQRLRRCAPTRAGADRVRTGRFRSPPFRAVGLGRGMNACFCAGAGLAAVQSPPRGRIPQTHSACRASLCPRRISTGPRRPRTASTHWPPATRCTRRLSISARPSLGAPRKIPWSAGASGGRCSSAAALLSTPSRASWSAASASAVMNPASITWSPGRCATRSISTTCRCHQSQQRQHRPRAERGPGERAHAERGRLRSPDLQSESGDIAENLSATQPTDPAEETAPDPARVALSCTGSVRRITRGQTDTREPKRRGRRQLCGLRRIAWSAWPETPGHSPIACPCEACTGAAVQTLPSSARAWR